MFIRIISTRSEYKVVANRQVCLIAQESDSLVGFQGYWQGVIQCFRRAEAAHSLPLAMPLARLEEPPVTDGGR
jgi:hypothetical protein